MKLRGPLLARILFQVVLITSTVVLGFAVGFSWRARSLRTVSSNEVPSSQIPKSLAVAGEGSFKHRRFTKPGAVDDSPLATQLEHDLSMSSGVTRWLYWLEAIEKATVNDMPRLARIAGPDTAALRLVASRWIDLDPRHLFDTLGAAQKNGAGFPTSELTTALFEEWVKRDPNAVIAALTETKTGAALSDWRRKVASSIFEKDPERGLQLMADWQIHNRTPRLTAVSKWAAADPRHAAEFVMAHQAGSVSRSTMEVIAKEWTRLNPAEAMNFATARSGSLNATLAVEVLKNWTGQSLDEAARWLAGTDAATRQRFSSAFVEAWGRTDASAALQWAQSNLTGSELSRAVAGLIKGAVGRNPDSAMALVTDMKASSLRSEAAAAAADNLFRKQASPIKPIRPEIIQWLSGLDNESVCRALDRIHGMWAETDPRSMASFLEEFLKRCPPENVSPRIPAQLINRLARVNPAEALALAGHWPTADGISGGSETYAEWRQRQPEAASKWWSNLPANDPRREPFMMNALEEVLDMEEPTAAQLAKLTDAERKMVLQLVERMDSTKEPELAARKTKILHLLKSLTSN